MNTPNLRKIVAAGAIGNVLEWYDFAIYGYFAAAIGRTFFPHADPVAQVLSAFGIFAIGFLMRPIGGALIGQLGDRVGRVNALTVSIVMMAVPTFVVAILPGYSTLGVAAPIILTLMRMVQGLSLGGECTTSMVFMVENAPPHHRGFVGAMACVGSVTGMLLGSATGALLAWIAPVALETWAWRIPFAVGLLVGLAGLFLRRRVQEVPTSAAEAGPSLLVTLHDHWRLIVRIACLTMFMSVGFYVMFVYIVSWLQMADGVAPDRALGLNTVSMVAMLPVMLISGWASDHLGRRPFALAATGFGFLTALPSFWLMYQTNPSLILLGQFGFVVAVGMLAGVQPALMVEATPSKLRCTAIALGFNVTLGVVGGLSPLVATWLVYRTASTTSPAFLVMAAAAISLVTVALFFRDPPLSATACDKSVSQNAAAVAV